MASSRAEDLKPVFVVVVVFAHFQEFIEIIFKFSADLGVRNESTVKSGIFPRRRFETRFLYLAEYSVKNFITTRQYLVNLTCNC